MVTRYSRYTERFAREIGSCVLQLRKLSQRTSLGGHVLLVTNVKTAEGCRRCGPPFLAELDLFAIHKLDLTAEPRVIFGGGCFSLQFMTVVVVVGGGGFI